MELIEIFRGFTRLQKLVLLALAYCYISAYCPATIVGPFLPQEAERHNVTKGVIGLMFSSSSLMSVISMPFVGMSIAAVGPKLAFIFGIIMNGTFSILFGLLEHITSELWFTVGTFMCLGLSKLGQSTIYTTTLTYAAKMFPENLSLIIGTTETMISISDMISLFFGGILHDLGGHQLPFVVFGVLHFLALPIDIYILPRDRKEDLVASATQQDVEVPPTEKDMELVGMKKSWGEAGKDGDNLKDPETKEDPVEIGKENKPDRVILKKLRPWHLLKIPGTMLMACSVTTAGLLFSFLFTTLEPHLRELELSSTGLATLFLLVPIFYGVASPCWGWVADKMDPTWPLMSGGLISAGMVMICFGPFPFISGWENTLWHNIIMLPLFSLCNGAAIIPGCEACLYYTFEAGHPDNVATYAVVASLISFSFYAGGTIGAASGGFLIQKLGFPYTCVVFGSFNVCWGIFIIFYFTFCHKTPANAGRKRSLRRKAQSPKESPPVNNGEVNNTKLSVAVTEKDAVD